jgi:hypothetical protein
MSAGLGTPVGHIPHGPADTGAPDAALADVTGTHPVLTARCVPGDHGHLRRREPDAAPAVLSASTGHHRRRSDSPRPAP